MFNFILHILNAILWTWLTARETYKASKNICFIVAFLWWLCVIIDIVEFAVY